MHQEIKSQWIAALRSGKYKQGFGELRIESNNGKGFKYCCLGVLCDLGSKSTDVEFKHNNDYLTWAGFGSWNLLPITSKGNLIVLNDKKKLSFNEIADIIEKEF